MKSLKDILTPFTGESPIEEALAGALKRRKHFVFNEGEKGFLVIRQAPVGPYFSDFMIYVATPKGTRRFVAECDGKDYHSSEEQIKYDKARDDYFNEQGLFVFRITGAEIYRSADDCAERIENFISKRFFGVDYV